MSKRLDDLSRNLASGMSRRQALQVFAGGLLAAAFGGSMLKAQAAGGGKTMSDICKSICAPLFTGQGSPNLHGYQANYGEFVTNITYPGNYANYSPYDACIATCQPCQTDLIDCTGPGEACVQADYGGQLAEFCVYM